MKKILCITPVKHLSGVFELLESFGTIIYEPNISKDDLRKILAGADVDAIFTNPNKQGFILDASVLKESSVRVINTCSTGTNHIDMDYCLANGVDVWSLTKDMKLIIELPSTSELAFALMCSLFRKIDAGFNDVKNGGWDYEPFMGKQIKGSSIGIIGYGRLGKIMKQFCGSFGMEVHIYDPYEGYHDLDGLLQQSEIISLHVHVTDETRDMVDESFLARMKKGSYLVNTSRGELVDVSAIIDSIDMGHLSGYATDVIRDEFGDRGSSKLVEYSRDNSNVLITPHVGGMTWEGQAKAYTWAVNKFKEEV